MALQIPSWPKRNPLARLRHQAVWCLHPAVTTLHDAVQLATTVTDPVVKQPVFCADGMFQSPV